MESDPILLVHGLFGRLSNQEIVAAFGSRTVLAPDLIGYGENRTGVPEAWTLEDQVNYIADWLDRRDQGPVHVVGHSVGGAIAMLFACKYPRLVRSITSVESYFTLADAFWSQKIALQDLTEIEAEVAGFRRDVPAWIGKAGVPATPVTLAIAADWLDNQPVSTLRAQARAVVDATRRADFLKKVGEILDSGLPLHLIAGARSRGGWSVPEWVTARAASNTEIPNAGHLMMLEAPTAFASAVCANLA